MSLDNQPYMQAVFDSSLFHFFSELPDDELKEAMDESPIMEKFIKIIKRLSTGCGL